MKVQISPKGFPEKPNSNDYNLNAALVRNTEDLTLQEIGIKVLKGHSLCSALLGPVLDDNDQPYIITQEIYDNAEIKYNKEYKIDEKIYNRKVIKPYDIGQVFMRRLKECEVSQQLLGLDFDNKIYRYDSEGHILKDENNKPIWDKAEGDEYITPDKVLAKCKTLNIEPFFIYQTFSSKPDHLKFRVLFALKEASTNLVDNFLLRRTIHELFPQSDPACQQANSLFHGTNGILPDGKPDTSKILYKNWNAYIDAENILAHKYLVQDVISNIDEDGNFIKNSNYTEPKMKEWDKKQWDKLEKKCKLWKVFKDGEVLNRNEITKILYQNLYTIKDGKEKIEEILEKHKANYVGHDSYKTEPNFLDKYKLDTMCPTKCNSECRFYATCPNNSKTLRSIGSAGHVETWEINNKKYDINFINMNNKGNHIIAKTDFFTFVDNILFEEIKHNFINLEHGNYRIWNEEEGIWKSWLFDTYEIENLLEKFFKQFTELSFRGYFEEIIDVYIRPKLHKYLINNRIKIDVVKRRYIPITFMNGTLYIKFDNKYNVSYEFKENEYKKENYCIYKIKFDFAEELIHNTNLDGGLMKDYLDNFFSKEHRDQLQMFLGTILEPQLILQNMFTMIGEGADGKSQLGHALVAIYYGINNVTFINVADWHKSFKTKDFATSILNISSELKDKEIDIDTFKKITGSDDIYIEAKFKDQFPIKPYSKHIQFANNYPKFEKFDFALQRRFTIVKIVKPENLKQDFNTFEWESRFADDNCLYYLVSFMLNGLINFLSKNMPVFKTIDEEDMNELINTSENIGVFIDDITEKGATMTKITNEELMILHKTWIDRKSPNTRNLGEFRINLKMKQTLKIKKIPFQNNIQVKNNKKGWLLPLNDYAKKLLDLNGTTWNDEILPENTSDTNLIPDTLKDNREFKNISQIAEDFFRGQ